jgi:hypothetical protein
MTPLALKSIFVTIYLIIDIVYVLLSRSYYESYARAIQGSGFPKKQNVLLFAVLSYSFLALAWWILVADRIQPTTSLYRAIFYAFVLALGVYGVFNATLYVMFEKWDYWVSLRDTMWGITWLSVLTLLYTMAVKYVSR